MQHQSMIRQGVLQHDSVERQWISRKRALKFIQILPRREQIGVRREGEGVRGVPSCPTSFLHFLIILFTTTVTTTYAFLCSCRLGPSKSAVGTAKVLKAIADLCGANCELLPNVR